MKKIPKIPVYNICNLYDTDVSDIAISDLRAYLNQHDNLVFPHRHSFFQVLYITHDGGNHVVDFETYDVREGMIFFLSPGQVHEWIFTDSTEGILINFSVSFFSTYLANSHYLNNLIFFTGNGRHAMCKPASNCEDLDRLFCKILREFQEKSEGYQDMIRALLVQVFTLTQRNMQFPEKQSAPQLYQQLKDFEQLLEQHFTRKKLPKDYAAMLFITPNYLNSLCNRLIGRPAGELIRNRILLEAKRLLVNSSLSVSEIAWE
ncbi:MAG: AraC family transcriptional regulator, partial [Flavobacterium psychrophilum]